MFGICVMECVCIEVYFFVVNIWYLEVKWDYMVYMFDLFVV